MLKILSLDPSGNGTTGLCLIKGQIISFQEFQNKDWTSHLTCVAALINTFSPDLLLYENTNYLHAKTQAGLDLFRLLGAIESLPIQKASILVSQVKDLKSKLFKGKAKIKDLEFKLGQGWFYQTQRISLHQLDAFLVYWLWKGRNLSAFNKDKKKKGEPW